MTSLWKVLTGQHEDSEPVTAAQRRTNIDIAPGVSLAISEREWSKCRARLRNPLFGTYSNCQGTLNAQNHVICDTHGVDHGPYQGG